MSQQDEVVQHPFLNNLRRSRTLVTVYLCDGTKLDGVIGSFDSHVVLLRGEQEQTIRKGVISTIIPRRGTLRPKAPVSTPTGKREVTVRYVNRPRRVIATDPDA